MKSLKKLIAMGLLAVFIVSSLGVAVATATHLNVYKTNAPDGCIVDPHVTYQEGMAITINGVTWDGSRGGTLNYPDTIKDCEGNEYVDDEGNPYIPEGYE